MKRIVYYVATTIDGYIAGNHDSIDGFVSEGAAVDKYLNDLKEFDTVIMGRRTYEFGYAYGLEPGQPPYPHMQHYIFSNSLTLENIHPKVHIRPPDLDFIKNLKKEKGTDIYLCGGGLFAGWLLDQELIDILKIKLNPLIMGEGIRLFGDSKKKYKTKLLHQKTYDHQLSILEYKLLYH